MVLYDDYICISLLCERHEAIRDYIGSFLKLQIIVLECFEIFLKYDGEWEDIAEDIEEFVYRFNKNSNYLDLFKRSKKILDSLKLEIECNQPELKVAYNMLKIF